MADGSRRRRKIQIGFSGEVIKVSPAWCRKIISSVLRCENCTTRREVSVLITDNNTIRRLNREYLNHNRATDVISFWMPANILGPKEAAYLGDIVVSAQMAERLARRLRMPYKVELARYLVHGILHLLGYKDKTAKEKNTMTHCQEQLLKNILGNGYHA